ncbi:MULTISPECIES: efflux RND transporter periplasmic adaptor subunit [unclassified Azospirillum]|uniref:efflux RND transporter periplasmic adaptor subunit n=1 Tax=unclassified Azospirillum TaxID=2630922 RepID=UPI000B65107B|nr:MULTISPECIES: efflux RND transporter periplasmic adaptor subunit [unclassified Azospirillum]SNS18742.1 membrane fusion protein, macrolide-specific efflux system [Azospirillum sp. RU38E]SNS36402.1 membrane fusion protein, macrolide-specific efflux system [Azospirillum sp. RU37A]
MQPSSPVVATGSPKPATPRRGKGKSRRLLPVGLAALVLLGGGAWWWFGVRSTGPDNAHLLTAAVERGDIEDTVSAVGNLQPRDYVDVGTQVSGQLRKLHVEIGQTVEQGTLLAEIDPTVYQTRVEADKAQLENYSAQLAQREAELALARQQYQRQKNLLKDNATSQDAYQSAETSLRAAEASVRVMNAQIRQTTSTLRGDEANLGYTKIYAPMTGTVVSQNAKQGQTLNANQSAPIVLRIADLSAMTVTTEVSEADVSRLKVGMPAYFTTLGRPDRRWQGTLRQVEPTPTVENNVVLYNALFDVGNEGGELMTQMTAQVFFIVASAKDVVRVPVAALQAPQRPAGPRQPGQRPPGAETAGGPSARPGPPAAGGERPAGGARGKLRMVTVLKPDGTTEERRVTIGVSDRIHVEITDGLKEGEQVVIGRAPSAGQMQAQRQQNQQNAQRMRPPGVL